MKLTVLAAGPLFAAPLSEEYGRNALYIPFMAVFIVLQIGVALVHNIGGFLFLRLLSGIAVSPPATLGAGTINDVSPPSASSLITRYGNRDSSKLLECQLSLLVPLSDLFSVPSSEDMSLRMSVGDGQFGSS
jgi:hypothetical protein